MTTSTLSSLFSALWNDDGGAVLASEYMALGSVVVLGGVAGLSTLRDSVNDEMKEFGGAIRAMRQSYSAPGYRSGVSSTAASGARDQAGGRQAGPTGVPVTCNGENCP